MNKAADAVAAELFRASLESSTERGLSAEGDMLEDMSTPAREGESIADADMGLRQDVLAFVRFLLWARDEASIGIRDAYCEARLDECITHLSSKHEIDTNALF